MVKKTSKLTGIPKSSTKKFIWDEILNQFPKKEHDALVSNILPRELGISYETLNRYRKIPTGSVQDIPTVINLRLCEFFNVKPSESVLDALEPIAPKGNTGTHEQDLVKSLGLSV